MFPEIIELKLYLDGGERLGGLNNISNTRGWQQPLPGMGREVVVIDGTSGLDEIVLDSLEGTTARVESFSIGRGGFSMGKGDIDRIINMPPLVIVVDVDQVYNCRSGQKLEALEYLVKNAGPYTKMVFVGKPTPKRMERWEDYTIPYYPASLMQNPKSFSRVLKPTLLSLIDDMRNKINDREQAKFAGFYAAIGTVEFLTWAREKLEDYVRTACKDDELLNKAAEIIDQIYYLLPERHEKGTILIAEDCAKGVIANVNPEKLYSPQEQDKCFIIKEYFARGSHMIAYGDYLATTHGKLNMNIAPLWHPVTTKDNSEFALGSMVIGPDLANLFTDVLNPEIRGGNKIAAEIKTRLIDLNINDLIEWQTNSPIIRHEPHEVLQYYIGNLKNVFKRAGIFTEFTRYGEDSSEFGWFGDALKIMEMARYDKDTVVRNLDNSPSNSGIRLGIIRAGWGRVEEELVVDGRVNSEKIGGIFFHWDTGYKHGHFLEDFIQITDSFECDLSNKEIGKRYARFIKSKFGESANMKDFVFDRLLVGFYRNLRKRDLVTVDYAVLNELRYRNGKKEEGLFQKKREDYQNKVKHYNQRALEYIKSLESYIMGVNKSELKEVQDCYSELKKADADASAEGFAQCHKVGKCMEWLKEHSNDDNNPKAQNYKVLLNLARVMYIKHTLTEMGNKSTILFEELTKPANQQYILPQKSS